jgi:replicative DNA helicase
METAQYSEEIERAILGAMMYNNELIPEIMSLLSPPCFHIPDNQLIYNSAVSLFNNKKSVSEWTLSEDLKKKGYDKFELGTLASYPDEAPPDSAIKSCCHELIEKYKLRFLITKCSEVARNAGNYAADPDQLLYQLNSDLKDYNAKTAEFTTVKSLMRDCIVTFEERQKSKNTIFGLRTGMIKFDETTGGLADDDFIIIGARPSMGKTAFMLSIITGVCKYNKKKNVVVFSLESKKEKLGVRMIGQKAMVDTRAIASGTIDKNDQDSLDNIYEAAGDISEYNITFIDEPNMQFDKLISTAIYLNSQEKTDLVCIDYAQLIGLDPKKDKTSALEELSKGLKGLARTINCPVVSLAQLNRSLESRTNKRPMMSDLKGSGAFEQDADIIMFIYRDVVYNTKTDSPDDAEIIIGKSRDSDTGKFHQKFIPEYTLFKDYDGNQWG